MQALTLDIGNTHSVAGFFDSNGSLKFQIRFRTLADATPDEYRHLFFNLIADKTGNESIPWNSIPVAICSVVPALDDTLVRAFAGQTILKVTSETPRKFDLSQLPFPQSLGADRLANIAGAMTLGKGPYLIVDAGTATTFCLVDEMDRYVGGAITPGLEISWKSLQQRAAKLFAIEMKIPEYAVGRTTEHQLQSGVLLGYQHLISGLSQQLIREASESNPEFGKARWLATGGCTHLLNLPAPFETHPDLTLIGLHHYLIWQRSL